MVDNSGLEVILMDDPSWATLVRKRARADVACRGVGGPAEARGGNGVLIALGRDRAVAVGGAGESRILVHAEQS